VEGWGESLTTLPAAGAIVAGTHEPTRLWLTVYVPKEAPKGAHATTLTLTTGAGALAVPVTLTVFDFALPDEIHFASQRNVIVAGLVPAGGEAKANPGDPHNVVVEGTKVINDEPTTDGFRVIRRSTVIDLVDGSLSVVAGGRSDKTGDYAYTFLAYLEIEPVD